MKKILYIAILILLNSAVVKSADIHVGSGQTYTTITDGITASNSGDTIIVHSGNYNEYYLIPKSGTTIKNATGESRPIIDSGQTEYHSSDSLDVFVFYPARSNVTIDGLDIRNGGRNCIKLSDSGAENITIQNCIITLNGWSSYAVDNAACIYIEPSSSTSGIIKNNIITSTIAGVHGIIGFQGTGNWQIENNEIHISGNGGGSKDSHGIFWKHGGTGATQMSIKNNVIWTSGYSSNGGIWVVNDNTLIENNLIVSLTGMLYGLTIGGSMGVTGGDNCVVNHNTVDGATRVGLKYEDGYYPNGCSFTNNVISKITNDPSDETYGAYNLWLYGSSYASYSISSNYNLIYDSGSSDIVKRGSPVGAYTLAEWKALGYDANSVNSSPGFKNTSGNLNTISDFEIISGDANNASSDSNDIGVDVTLIGNGLTSRTAAGATFSGASFY